MTTSARPRPFRSPSFPPVPVRSFRLSAPVSGRFLFLPFRLPPLSLRLPSVPDTQLPVLPFCPPRLPPPSGFLRAPVSSFDSSGSSPSLPPGFPFGLSGSAYSASCSFPFALPRFAPTAVPQVLPLSLGSYSLSSRICPCVRSLRFHPGRPVLPLRSRPFRIPLLGLRFFLSPLQRSASRWLPACPPRFPLPLSLVPRFGLPPSLRSPPSAFASFGSLPSGFGTQLRCSSVHRFTVCLTVALRAACLPSRVQAFPLAPLPLRFLRFRSALGSGYWACRYTLKTEHRFLILLYYVKTSLSLRFGQAFGLLVSVSYTHYCASTSDLSTT